MLARIVAYSISRMDTPSEAPQTKPLHKRYRRAALIAVFAGVVIVVVLAAFFWPETKALIVWAKDMVGVILDVVRKAGPLWYFLAYAVLPAVGVPISVFNLSVNPTFGPQIGLAWVIILAALCLMCANALSYWLARYALRPMIERLVKALGYTLPVIPPEEHVTACILLRVVPGAPYVVQSYILGLAQVRFVPYMIVSFIGQFGWALAMIIFGNAFMDGGSFKAGFVAVVLIVLLVIGTRWVRKYYSKKTTLKIVGKADANG